MYSLTLNDGTEFACNFCAARNEVLTTSIVTDKTFREVAEIFSHITNTEKIKFWYGEMNDKHDDFTDLVLINKVSGNEYMISLRKAE